MNDWEDLGNPEIMGINGVQSYINTKDTFGYRIPKPTIHTNLFAEAGEIAKDLETKNDEREKAVKSLKEF